MTADYKIHFAQLNLQRLPDSLSFSRRLTYRDVLELCANPQSDLFICPSIPAQMASMAILAFECLEKILPWSPVIDIFLASHGNNKVFQSSILSLINLIIFTLGN